MTRWYPKKGTQSNLITKEETWQNSFKWKTDKMKQSQKKKPDKMALKGGKIKLNNKHTVKMTLTEGKIKRRTYFD